MNMQLIMVKFSGLNIIFNNGRTSMTSLRSFCVTDIFYETQSIPFYKIITVIHLH